MKTGHHAAIPRLAFRPPDARVAGFEIVELAAMHRRRGAGLGDAVHRVDFHTITFVADGRGEHEIDFVTYPCRPGTVLWVRPGQAQRFTRPGTTEGVHVLFTPAFPAPAEGVERLLGGPDGPPCVRLHAGAALTAVRGLVDQLRAEYGRPEAEISAPILALLLAALMLQLDRLAAGDRPRGDEVFARFREELERSYATTRRAEDYARSLGYTVRTLTRACLAATGQPAKQVIDNRVALEAQRLLAYSDEPAAAIADRLGFSEPTNFGKFFTRHTGMTPGRFRSTHRGA